MPLPVFINGAFVGRNITGVERYAIELIKALDQKKPVGYTLLAPELPDFSLRHIAVSRVGLFKGKLWQQFSLPFHARGGVLFSPFPAAPLLKKRHIVTIHDAVLWVHPKAYSLLFRMWYKLLIPALGRSAARVTTVSRFSKAELSAKCHIPSKSITVIPNGHEHITGRASDDTIIKRLNLRRPFILAVGSSNPNKNFNRLLEAFKMIKGMDLIVVGSQNPRVFSAAEAPESAKFVGHLDDSELKALYKQASVFVQPSLYEGFGLPALEAAACGCAIAASDIPPLREILGEEALFFDPLSPVDMADKIRTAASSPNECSIQQEFSWDRSAESMMAEIEALR